MADEGIKSLEMFSEAVKHLTSKKVSVGFPTEFCMMVHVQHEKYLTYIVLDIIGERLMLGNEFGKNRRLEDGMGHTVTKYSKDVGLVDVNLIKDIVDQFVDGIVNNEYYPGKTVEYLEERNKQN